MNHLDIERTELESRLVQREIRVCFLFSNFHTGRGRAEKENGRGGRT
jgi:hypothetical protein